MARQPQVTRTIVSTEVVLLCVNTESAEVFNKTVSLARTYKDDKAILKAVEKANLIGENEKAVSVAESRQVEKLYGMSETDFIHYAKELPPRTPADTPAEA